MSLAAVNSVKVTLQRTVAVKVLSGEKRNKEKLRLELIGMKSLQYKTTIDSERDIFKNGKKRELCSYQLMFCVTNLSQCAKLLRRQSGLKVSYVHKVKTSSWNNSSSACLLKTLKAHFPWDEF